MSRIDEAFINAYAERGDASLAVVGSSSEPRWPSPDAPRSAVPHFQVQQPRHDLRVFANEKVELLAEDGTDSNEMRIDAPHLHHYKDNIPLVDADCREQANDYDADPYCEDEPAAKFDSLERTESLELPPASRSPSGVERDSMERRPLSSFAEPVAPPAVFKPLFEVDAYRWPAITEPFCQTRGELLQPVVERLADGAREGRAMVGFAGTRLGVGTSTVAMCVGRLLAARGKNVALVDANFATGDLARQLGIEFDAGWEDALSGGLPLAECVIHALADRVSLVPLKGPLPESRESLAGIQTSVVAGVLRYHYDLVLFDLGAPGGTIHWAAAESIIDYARLDVGIVIADSEEAEQQTSQAVAEATSLFGSSCLGVIGNSSR